MTDPAFGLLLDGVRGRDPECAITFVRMYRPGLVRYAGAILRRTGAASSLDPEDICQSVLLTFLGWLDRGGQPPHDPEKVGQLLRKSARNRITDDLRQLRAARRGGHAAVSTNTDDLLDSIAADCGTPSANVSRDEMTELLQAQLTPEEYELLERRRGGTGWVELAEEIGSSPEALRKRVNRAVTRVLRRLDAPA
jgi:RNA polymerase sigma factor (sigma-70 family)